VGREQQHHAPLAGDLVGARESVVDAALPVAAALEALGVEPHLVAARPEVVAHPLGQRRELVVAVREKHPPRPYARGALEGVLALRAQKHLALLAEGHVLGAALRADGARLGGHRRSPPGVSTATHRRV